MFNKNEVVVEEKESVQFVIFIKEGKLKLEKEITLDHTNYWPVASQNWEVNTTKTT